MTTGTQTLTLEQIQAPWLPTHLHKKHRLTTGLIVGLIDGLVREQNVVPRSRQRLDLTNFNARPSLVGGLIGGLAAGLLRCFEPMPALRPTTTPSAAIRADTTGI